MKHKRELKKGKMMKKLFLLVLIGLLGQLTTYAESAEIEIDSVTISLGELQCDIFLLDHITGEDCVREWLKGELSYGFPYLYVFILVEYNNIPDNFPAFPPCVDNSILSMDDLEVTNGVVTGVYGDDKVSTYGGFRYNDTLDYQMIVEVIDPTIPVTVTLKADSFWSGCANTFHPSTTATWNPPTLDPTPDPTPDPDPEPEPIVITPAQSGEKGQIVFSEMMFESKGGLRSLPQWFEVFNTTDTEINVRGWQLALFRRKPSVLDVTVQIQEDFIIPAKSSRLIVSMGASNSGGLLEDNFVYSLFRHHSADLEQESGQTRNRLVWREGFYLKLLDGEGTLIDYIGTITDKENDLTWELPECLIEGKRSSLIRRFDKGVPRLATKKEGWIRAYNTNNIKHRPKDMWYGNRTDIGTPGYRSDDKPLPVELSMLSARVIDGKVVINWVTESELDNAGFNILRSRTKQGPFVQVNRRLIQGAGTTGKRSTYTWIDTTANPNTAYYYRIEDVSFAGTKRVIATRPVRGIFTAKNRLTTQWGKLKTR